MKTIFSIIALPITIIISIICFLFVLIFESDLRSKDGFGVLERMLIKSRSMMLMEAWESIPDMWKGIISIIVYYILFF